MYAQEEAYLSLVKLKIILRPSWSIRSLPHPQVLSVLNAMKAFSKDSLLFQCSLGLLSWKKLSDRKCDSVLHVYSGIHSQSYTHGGFSSNLFSSPWAGLSSTVFCSENLSHFGCPCTLSSISSIWGSASLSMTSSPTTTFPKLSQASQLEQS